MSRIARITKKPAKLVEEEPEITEKEANKQAFGAECSSDDSSSDDSGSDSISIDDVSSTDVDDAVADEATADEADDAVVDEATADEANDAVVDEATADAADVRPSTYVIQNNIHPVIITDTSLSWKILHILTILVLVAALMANNETFTKIKMF